MNRYQIAQLNRGERTVAFGVNNPSYFAAGKGAQLMGAVQTQLAAIRQIAGQQGANTGSALGATGVKKTSVAELWDDMIHICRTFRTVKKKNPALAVTFEMPAEREEAIVNGARAFALNLPPLEAEFIDWGMDADFLADLNADIAAYVPISQNQDNLYGEREGDTDDLAVAIQNLVGAIDDLDTLMSNILRANALILGQWREASHYEKPPRAKQLPQEKQKSAA